MSNTSTDGGIGGGTILRKKGIEKRMKCSGQVAHRIEEAFVTAEQLAEAVESDRDLTEYDGIGPKTADVIEDWWEKRFEREEQVGPGTLELGGSNGGMIYFHTPWDEAIETESGDQP